MKKIVVNNKKATFNYFLEYTVEAGMALLGSEVKSIRAGHVSIKESYIKESKGELFLCNSHISEFPLANRFNHNIYRERKILCHRKEINKIMGKVKMSGYTIIPTMLYFNEKNLAKLSIAVARGKKLHDKRESIKTREWNRNKDRILKIQNNV